MNSPLRPLIFLCLLILVGCQSMLPVQNDDGQAPRYSPEQQQQANTAADELFNEYYQFAIEQSPVLRSRLGISGQFDWDDISPEAREQQVIYYQNLRNRLHAIDEEALSADHQASYRTLLSELEFHLLMVPFEPHQYAFSQMGGWHTLVADVLINNHPISSVPEARDYISRLEAIPALFKRWNENIRNAEEDGILPPAFVYPAVVSSMEAIITGIPFDNGPEPSPLWADFNSKLDQLNLYPSSRKLLERQARSALLQSVQPAYRSMLTLVRDLQQRAPEHQAALNLTDGLRYYQLLLAHYTNSPFDADHIHQLGLTEVTRIQQEILTLMPVLGYPSAGSQNAQQPLRDFFQWMEERSYRFPDNQQGRDEFIGYQKNKVRQMAERLPYFFTHLPVSPIVVKAVEDYRQSNAPIAFYEAPSMDGTRPGIYYVNPARMNDLPRYRLAALAFHEALPGHHMQIALTQENEQLPDFRRTLGYSAFSEGWALYAEKLAAEMGAYESAEEEYGRLIMELWRAMRLVLDTGLHAKGWSREQAIHFRLENTPFSRADSEAAINRYLVMPGQATSYKMGELRILSIRQQVRDILGSRFDLASFHSALLSQGALPLDVLQEWMIRWAKQQKQGAELTAKPATDNTRETP
ncbi:MAG: DUF885 domain-containing protein [Saccharospirillaceae bacterium]|nr:DUF885 domain-containing protein [Saccharospirillaceae bacterium]MCD8532345.1 DUF885 domain-containing protein [Saccharospirillaceae bacterium]